MLVKLFAVIGGLALVAVLPPQHFPSSERGFLVGVLMTAGAAIAVHGSMSEGNNELRV